MSKTKQSSDVPTPRFEHGGSDHWFNTLPLEHGGPPIKDVEEDEERVKNDEKRLA